MKRLSLRRAFTLVELLVVIGIIAVLIAVLLPALAAARRQANAVKCASNLRQVAIAFFQYAQNNKGFYPVAKWELPLNSPDRTTSLTALYWMDFVGKYVGKAGQGQSNVGDSGNFAEARKTVLWGCPAWDGVDASAIGASANQDGISIYETGYSFNIYPTYTALNPKPVGVAVPATEWAIVSPTENLVNGKWFKQNKWTDPARRMLVADAYLWLLQFYPCTTAAGILPQNIGRTPNYSTGGTTLDRYRHGKIPGVAPGNTFDKRGGKIGFNMAMCDGHVEYMTTMEDAWKAIRMRGF